MSATTEVGATGRVALSRGGRRMAVLRLGGEPTVLAAADLELRKRLATGRFVFNPRTDGLRYCEEAPTEEPWWSLWVGEVAWPNYAVEDLDGRA